MAESTHYIQKRTGPTIQSPQDDSTSYPVISSVVHLGGAARLFHSAGPKSPATVLLAFIKATHRFGPLLYRM
jgi:hypothetical protein